MPFQSEKQRKYLWANEPEIARDWTDKYGSRVKKQEGGISATWIPGHTKPIDLLGIPQQHMTNWGDALTAKNKPWTTTPEYHQWGTEDLVREKSKQLAGIPYIGGLASRVFEDISPYLAFGGSFLYDPAQAAFSKYPDDPGKYETNNKWDKINAYFPDLQGTTAAGILNAIDQENVLSAAYNRMIGAGKVGIESKINRQNQIQELFGKGWDAIKNEFGGSAQAADLSGIIPKNLEKTIEEGMQSYKKFNEISPALRKAIEEGTSYNEWDMIPNEKYHGIPMKRISSNQDDPFKDYIYEGPRSYYDDRDEEGLGFSGSAARLYKTPRTIADQNRILGRTFTPRNMGMLERFRNKFYKPAAGAVNYGGKTYSPAQLNRMNALGGYYSEPARQQRRLDARRTNILNRAAKGKPVGNVNKLLGKYGYSGTPGSGTLQFTGRHEGSSTAGAGYSRSDDSWSSSPFRRGGLASLWQR